MLEEMFGNSPSHKLFDYLEKYEPIDFPISELAKQLELSEPTVREGVKILLKSKLIKINRKIGNSSFYTINKSKTTEYLRKAMMAHAKEMREN